MGLSETRISYCYDPRRDGGGRIRKAGFDGYIKIIKSAKYHDLRTIIFVTLHRLLSTLHL